MANKEQLEHLKRDVEEWNQWRIDNPFINPDLYRANLEGADLHGADLREANLQGAYLEGADLNEANLYRADLREVYLSSANLRGADLEGVDLRGVDLTSANLRGADLRDANLQGADLRKANLQGANLRGADLREVYLSSANLNGANLNGANLNGTDLYKADLSSANLSSANLREVGLNRADLRGVDLRGADLTGADLTSANLSGAILIETNLSNTILSGCHIYGISAWNLKIEGAIQKNLVISNEEEPVITVDNLEVAQFIYLLLHNEKIRHVIDTITTKTVLILGRFTDERKAILDAIREELRKRDYIPILFDFDKPTNRDLTETVMTLFSLARFVIADLSDPHSIPHELMVLAEKMPSVPIQPLFHPTPEHLHPYPMFEHFLRYQHVLDIYPYDDQNTLIAVLKEKIIDPAEAKVEEMKLKKLW